MSWAVWISGLSGSGKTALAWAAATELRARGEPVRVLALDELRRAVTPRGTGSEAERDVLCGAVVYVAAVLVEADVPVLLDAASRRIWRELAREAIARFAEVELICAPEVRQERRRERPPDHPPGDVPAFAQSTGVVAPGGAGPHEPSLSPELVIDTSQVGLEEATARVVDLVGLLAEPRPDTEGEAGTGTAWAIWITGRPGSGKTAVSERVAEALVGRGIRVRVLDLVTVRNFLSPAGPITESFEEIAHRTLVHAAKLLTEAGVTVVVDATAPRRAWREAARELIPCFAEVQLVCPAEICAERERASRWRLGAARWERMAGPSGPSAGPDLAVDYEESLRPDLVLRTNVRDLWSTAEQVVFLVHRLRRAAPLNLEQA